MAGFILCTALLTKSNDKWRVEETEWEKKEKKEKKRKAQKELEFILVTERVPEEAKPDNNGKEKTKCQAHNHFFLTVA